MLNALPTELSGHVGSSYFETESGSFDNNIILNVILISILCLGVMLSGESYQCIAIKMLAQFSHKRYFYVSEYMMPRIFFPLLTREDKGSSTKLQSSHSSSHMIRPQHDTWHYCDIHTRLHNVGRKCSVDSGVHTMSR